MFSPLVAATRLVLFLTWTVLFIPPYAVVMGLHSRVYRRMAAFYWRGCARILGMTLVVHGEVSRRHPTLFVANHASYLDVVVLGALVDAAFVAKQEVKGWPGIGLLAKLGRTIFVERRAAKTAQHRDTMTRRLDRERESLILFPEGTSNDGNRILPFKSGLFSVAELDVNGAALPVQPISVAYTRLDGLPLGHGWRPFFAWYGAMTLAPHLWYALGLGSLTVDVVFHPVVDISHYNSRKSLAEHCHKTIGRGVATANAGRLVLAR